MAKLRAWPYWGGQLLARFFVGKLSWRDLDSLVAARLRRGSSDLRVQGLTFPEADRLLWQLVLHVLVLDEYMPRGFAVREGDIVVDIGANRGAFVAAAALHKAGEIHAFEPDPQNCVYLERFLELNHLDWVRLHPQAVAGITTGARRLYAAGRHSRHSLRPSDVISGDRLDHFVEVPAVSLDDLLAETGPVDMLKMDCEGAEYEIFAAASVDSLEKVGRMVIEYHAPQVSEPVRELVGSLRQAGFAIRQEPSPWGDPLGMLFVNRADS